MAEEACQSRDTITIDWSRAEASNLWEYLPVWVQSSPLVVPHEASC